ncbi:hypothetical protein GCM10009851_37800 [Herbiconiux moechotypicola]|uniref:Uncharacterized protein n=2 Tax=Herbiconiux moechotypicola TaxID=637393 RepID=A0ABN3E580_9MICO
MGSGQTGTTSGLTIRNTGTTDEIAELTVVVSGMSEGFTAGSFPGTGWAYVSGESDSSVTFSYTGEIAAGGSSAALFLVISFTGSDSRPFSRTLSIVATDTSVDPISLVVDVAA